MKEAEWLASLDVHALVKSLAPHKHQRRLRLLNCGVCRFYQGFIRQEDVRKALDAAEQYADGALRDSTMRNWHTKVKKIAFGEKMGMEAAINQAVEYACRSRNNRYTQSWVPLALSFRHPHKEESQAVEVEQLALTLLRDIFGNRFRPVAIDPDWLAFQDGPAMRLAQCAYDERDPHNGTMDPARLVILADALEEAGCDNEEILNHCRQPGVHVRGCWPVDLVRGVV